MRRLDSRKALPLIIVLCVLIVFTLTACWGSEEKTGETGETTQEYTVNQPVIVGDAEWTVIGAEKPAAVLPGSEQPKQGVFLGVHAKCKNLSTESQSVPIAHVYDSQGNEGGRPTFGWSVNTPPEWGPDIVGESLLAGGGEATGYMLFEVMPDATGFKLQVTGFGFGDGKKTINLGI